MSGSSDVSLTATTPCRLQLSSASNFCGHCGTHSTFQTRLHMRRNQIWFFGETDETI